MVFASIDINLKYGARGTEVTELQEFLVDKGFLSGQATGNFFTLTRKAVTAYQSSVGLPNTGFVGILTRNKINTELSTADASSTQAEVIETGTTTQPTNTNQLAILNQQIAELNKKLEEQKQIQQQTQNTLQQTQQNVQQIQQNTTPAPYVPPPLISNLHVFSVSDNGSVIVNCKAKESGALSCMAELTVKYQTGRDINSLNRPKGVSVTISIPSINFSQTVTTDDGNYGGDSRIYAIFNIPIVKDGTYPVVLSADGASYNYNMIVDYIDRYKNNQCSNYQIFCNLSDVAYADMTPGVVKISENKELQQNLAPQVIGELKLIGIANSFISLLRFSTTSIPLVFRGANSMAQSGVNSNGATFTDSFNVASGNVIRILNQDVINPGSYTVTINSIEAYGIESGAKKLFVGLPMTFTFVVK